LQLDTIAHVGAAPPELPLDDAPLDAPLDVPEEESAAPLPDTMTAHGELQLCSAHCTKPLQSRLVQLEAAVRMLSADEQLLLTHALHVVVSVMPVTTETKASGLLHPPAEPLDPPVPSAAVPTEPVRLPFLFWLSLLEASSPMPTPLPSPPLFEEHATVEINEPAITPAHFAALVIPASTTCDRKLDRSRLASLDERAQFTWPFRPISVLRSNGRLEPPPVRR
jgi:hypothetical protein